MDKVGIFGSPVFKLLFLRHSVVCQSIEEATGLILLIPPTLLMPYFSHLPYNNFPLPTPTFSFNIIHGYEKRDQLKTTDPAQIGNMRLGVMYEVLKEVSPK